MKLLNQLGIGVLALSVTTCATTYQPVSSQPEPITIEKPSIIYALIKKKDQNPIKYGLDCQTWAVWKTPYDSGEWANMDLTECTGIGESFSIHVFNLISGKGLNDSYFFEREDPKKSKITLDEAYVGDLHYVRKETNSRAEREKVARAAKKVITRLEEKIGNKRIY